MVWLYLDDPFELLAKAMGPDWEPGLESPLRTRPARWASAIPSTDAAKDPATGVEEPAGGAGSGSEAGGRDAASAAASSEEWEHDWLPCVRADGGRIFVHRLRLRGCEAMNGALLSFAEDEALGAASEQASNAGGGYHSDRSLHTRAAVQVLSQTLNPKPNYFRGANRLFASPDLYWRSSEAGDFPYKSRGFKRSVCDHDGGERDQLALPHSG